MIQVVRVLLADGKGAGRGLLKMAGVEFLHQPDERNDVPGTGGLVAGVHGQLGQADVHAVHGYLRHGKVAQSAAADFIGTVGKILQRDTGAGGQLFGNGHAHAVAGVLLTGVDLDHNALVHVGAVVHIGVFRVVGVHGVGVVGAEHEAGRHRTVEVFIAGADVLRDAVQHVVQEGGSCALLGAGAHFFVVEEGGNVDGLGAVCVQKAFQDAEHALLVVQTAGGDELLIAAPDGGLFADAEEQVAAKDLLFCDLQLGGDQLFQHAFLGGTAQQGQHIHLLVVGSLVVDLAVHMDGHAGDHQQVAVQREQSGSDGIVLLYQHAACHRQRPVHPCGADHAAVALGVQLGVLPAHVDLGVFLDAETGGIRVGSGHVEAVVFQPFSHAECKDAGAVAADKIAPARFQLPPAALQQLGKALLQQDVPDGCSGVVCGRIAVNEGQQLLYFFFDHWKTLHGFIGLDAPILLLRFALCNSRSCGRGRICFTLRGFYSILLLSVNIESTGKAGNRHGTQ